MDRATVKEYCVKFKAGTPIKQAMDELKLVGKKPGDSVTVNKIQRAVKAGDIKFDEDGLPELPDVLPWETVKKVEKRNKKVVTKDPEEQATGAVLSELGQATAETAKKITRGRFALGTKLEELLTPYAANRGYNSVEEYVIVCCDFFEDNVGQVDELKTELEVRLMAIQTLKKYITDLQVQCQPIQVKKHRQDLISEFLTKVILLRAQGIVVPENIVTDFQATFDELAKSAGAT